MAATAANAPKRRSGLVDLLTVLLSCWAPGPVETARSLD
jgi:hypothetical protein